MQTASRTSSVDLVVRLAILTSAMGGLISMFIVGHRQRSVVLMVLFTAWVLSPFAGSWLVIARARDWPHPAQRTLQYGTLVTALGALARYAWVIARPLKAQPASTFLIVPFASWILLVAVAGVAMRMARRPPESGAR